MKKTLLGILLLSFFFTANAQKNGNIFYYYKGAKVYFPVSYDQLVVGIKPGHTFNELKTTVASLIAVSSDSLKETFNGKQLLVKLGHNKVTDISPLVSKLKQNSSLLYARPVFLSPSGNYNSYGDEFIVNLKSSTSFAAMQELMNNTGCTIAKKYPFQDDMYILSAGAKANYDGLAMANLFYESGLFDYAEPNKIVYNALHVDPNDPLYNLQWAHKNTGSAAQYNGTVGADMKVQEAWTVTMGSPSIKIGVIDEGADLTHPDIMANLLQGFNGATMTSGPGDGGYQYSGGAHGINCSGIIAAIANNGIGMAGVAPNCKIIPAVIFGGASGAYLGDAAVAASFDYVRLNGADVISNSWGGGSVSSTIDDAIHRAVTLGRGGLGCVVLFSSGNDNSAVSYPATNPEVISVGGISMCNQRKSPTSCDGESWWGANYGTGLDVVAPCVKIASTDIQGTAGYNTAAGVAGDYFNTFNGTSSACPNAAGVVALILSANSSLTVAQATAILEASCDKIPGYTFAVNAAQPNGTWNNELGHGRVNALTAVQMALDGICPHPTITGVALTQPACPLPATGTIVVSATGSGTLEYSLNGGVYQSSNTFNNLAPGNYTLTSRLMGGDPNCIAFYSNNPVVINPAPSSIVFTAPTITQPACPSPATGTIVVNATGNGVLEYSLNGGAWQLSNTFSGLAVGFYNISARLQANTLCSAVYLSNPVFINAANTAGVTVSYTGSAVPIPDNNAGGVNIPIAVSGAGSLADINFRLDADPNGTCNNTSGNTSASVDHTWIGDLVFKLTSPNGTAVTLISRPGGGSNSGNNFCTVTLDDEGGYPSIQAIGTTGAVTGNFTPNNPLSAFDGEDPNGTWVLNVSDRAGSDIGSVRRFSLVLTTSSPCPVSTTTSVLTSSLNPSCFGNEVTFTATVVDGSAAPVTNGTVTFKDGAAVIGTGITNVAGEVSVTTTTLTEGSHSITAEYAGDPGFAPSTGSLTQIITALPTVVATPVSQTTCSASPITTIVLSGTGTAYNWSRDNAATVTGIAASGAGDISGSLTNTTNAPVTVTFMITPTANNCIGTAITATVVVNPTPNAVATPSSQTICSGNAITTIVNNGSSVAGTVYNWSRDNAATVTGIAASGSGNISGSLTNTTGLPVTVTFTITPSYTNAGVTCTGTPVTATVTVNPVQYFTCPANMTETITDVICFKAVNTPKPVFCGTLTKLTWKLTGATTLSSPTSGINYVGLRNMNVGTTTVTYTATFTGGIVKTCSFTVLVKETIPPNVRCPLDKDVNTDLGKCYKTGPVSLGTPVVSENCGIASITNNAPAVYQKGVNLVTWTVTDKSGNTSTCVQRVTVYDAEKPVITCPANVIVNAGTGPNCNATQITLPNPVFTDNCEVVTLKWAMTGVTFGSSNTPGINYVPTMNYAVGVSTVTYTAIDAAGNAKTCTFTVTVKDVTAPTLVCPGAQTLCKVANNTYTIPPMIQSDNCAIVSTTYKITGATSRSGSGTNASGLFNLGVSTIKWTVKDSHGNISTCTTAITIVATSNPICTPPPPITFVEPGVNKKYTEAEAPGFSITAWPNPTVNYFNLKVNTAAKETVVIRMYDMAGKLVQVKNGAPGNIYIIGENVTSGMYIIEVSQGANKQKVKLVKLN